MADAALSSQGANAGSSDVKMDSSQQQASLDTNATEEVAGSGSTTINGTLDHPMQDSSQLNDSSEEQSAGTIVEAKIPSKKDATLREFISKMDEHAPIIPDAVTNYYFTLAGLPPPPETPLPLARLLALATQKFVADVAADAYQYSRIRTTTNSGGTISGMPGMPAPGSGPPVPGVAGMPGGGLGTGKDEKGKHSTLGMQRAGFGASSQGSSTGRTVLTMEDLGMAVGEYGVNVRRGEFYR